MSFSAPEEETAPAPVPESSDDTARRAAANVRRRRARGGRARTILQGQLPQSGGNSGAVPGGPQPQQRPLRRRPTRGRNVLLF